MSPPCFCSADLLEDTKLLDVTAFLCLRLSSPDRPLPSNGVPNGP